MIEELLKDIKETTEGYEVRNLKWNKLDNIIVGQVKCPVLGRENYLDGFITCQWRKNGKPTNFYKGREDLTLKFVYAD